MARDFTQLANSYLLGGSVPLSAAPITVSVWFNPDDTGEVQTLFGISTAGQNNHRFTLEFNTSNQILWVARDTGAGFATTAGSFTQSAWNHAVGVEIASNNRVAWLNGTASAADTGSRTPSGMNRTTIGAQRDSGASLFDGRIAEVGVWAAVLTNDQILGLSLGYAPPVVRRENLVFYAPLVRAGDVEYVGAMSLVQQATVGVGDHVRVITRRSFSVRQPAAPPSVGRIFWKQPEMTGLGTGGPFYANPIG
jgi:hypothetical protein